MLTISDQGLNDLWEGDAFRAREPKRLTPEGLEYLTRKFSAYLPDPWGGSAMTEKGQGRVGQ